MTELLQLPVELLESIVTYSIPEGFESLALSCGIFNVICRPFTANHNRLRREFRRFKYENRNPSLKIETASDLIMRIAIEPIVARYIKVVNFRNDCRYSAGVYIAGQSNKLTKDAVKLLASSVYLAQADSSWIEFNAEINEDLRLRRYSQRAAAFLLTLLPNVEELMLPRYWNPLDGTDKMIDLVVSKAKLAHSPCDSSSLALVTKIYPSVPQVIGDYQFDLNWVYPFLSLPRIRSLQDLSCLSIGSVSGNTVSPDPSNGFGSTVEVVEFVGCCIDEAGIARFLRRVPRLRSLSYSHTKRRNGKPQQWDICRFITEIEQNAGAHLEILLISTYRFQGSITPGQVSLRSFVRLQVLELPLKVLSSYTIEAYQTDALEACRIGYSADQRAGHAGSSIANLVPASVNQLSLTSLGTEQDGKILGVLFHDFSARQRVELPNLKEIFLSCARYADDSYKIQCAKLNREIKNVDVVLNLTTSPRTNQHLMKSYEVNESL